MVAVDRTALIDAPVEWVYVRAVSAIIARDGDGAIEASRPFELVRCRHRIAGSELEEEHSFCDELGLTRYDLNVRWAAPGGVIAQTLWWMLVQPRAAVIADRMVASLRSAEEHPAD